MKTFVTVLQISHDKFDVYKFNGNTSKSVYCQSAKKGITITIWESNSQNDKYCFSLAKKMNAL